MGYCYGYNRLTGKRGLCCDICGAVGARKVKCPVGWCPATATCPKPECKAKVKAIDHSACRDRHARDLADRDLLKTGKATFTVELREGVITSEIDTGKRYGFIVEAGGHDFGFAAMDIYRKTWVTLDDIESLRALGNTITVVDTSLA